MDWLAKYKVTINCKKKLIAFSNFEGVRSVFRWSSFQKSTPIISTKQARKLLKKGCYGYLCAVDVAPLEELEGRNIPIVTEFHGVFQEVPGLPPRRKIEFTIDLVPGIALISKTPYHMPPAELA